MTDTNPFDQFDTTGAPSTTVSGNPFDRFDEPAVTDKSRLPAAIADIPKEIKGAFNENLAAAKAGYEKSALGTPLLEQYGAVGRGLLAIPGMVAAPITGAVRSVAGHTIADTVQALGGRLDNNVVGSPESPEQAYQEAKDKADQLTLLAGTTGRPPGGVGPGPPPSGVLLSKGQETGDINLIRSEQAAYRNQLGEKAQERATQFREQQAGQVQDLSSRIGQAFDAVGNQSLAQNPQEAAGMMQAGLQRARDIEKAAVEAKYGAAKSAGGIIDARALQGMGRDIGTSLLNGPNPVTVDPKLTPWAAQSLSEIENAKEFNLNPGVSLQDVDQVRKRLVKLRSGAYGNNASDGRASSAVLNAFDDRIDAAVNSGAFSGNPQAVQAWNEARAASASFKQNFSGNDPVGTKIKNILGREDRDPLTPNDVADALYGASGTNPNSVNVGVANRVKTVLGENSPEWAAVKQGLWSRLTERGAGQTEMGPGMIAGRIAKFLNADGKEMAETVFNPQERQLIGQFGQLQRKLEVPKTGFNSSETATFLNKTLSAVGNKVTFMIGMKLAEHFGAGPIGEIVAGAAAEKGTGAVSALTGGRQIAKQMPLVSEAVDKWQKAVRAYDRANSAPSRVSLTLATSNLGRQLGHIGISLKNLLPGGAESQEKDQSRAPVELGQ